MESDPDNSNHSEDLFSEDDSPSAFLGKNFNLSPMLMKDASTDDDYVPSPEIKIETPLSLLPYLSNTPQVWSKDLETPEVKGHQEKSFWSIPRTPDQVTPNCRTPVTTKNLILSELSTSEVVKSTFTSPVSVGKNKRSSRRLISIESNDKIDNFKPDKLDKRLTSQDILNLLTENNNPDVEDSSKEEIKSASWSLNNIKNNNDLKVSEKIEIENEEDEKNENIEHLIDLIEQLKQKKSKPDLDHDTSVNDDDFVNRYKLMENFNKENKGESMNLSPSPPKNIPASIATQDTLEVDSSTSLYFTSLEINENEIDKICNDDDCETNGFIGFSREKSRKIYEYVKEWHNKFFEFNSCRGFTEEEIELKKREYDKHKKLYEEYLNETFPLGKRKRKLVKHKDNILPPVIFSVNSEFTKACDKKKNIKIYLNSNYNVQLSLLDYASELDIDLLIEKEDDNKTVNPSCLSSYSFWADNSQPRSNEIVLSGSVQGEICESCLNQDEKIDDKSISFETMFEKNHRKLLTINEKDEIVSNCPEFSSGDTFMEEKLKDEKLKVNGSPNESIKLKNDNLNMDEEFSFGDMFLKEKLKDTVSKEKMNKIDRVKLVKNSEDFTMDCESFDNVINLFPGENFQDIPKMNQGFKTAGGKNLLISEKALNTANKLYCEINVSEKNYEDFKENIHFKKSKIICGNSFVSPFNNKVINNNTNIPSKVSPKNNLTSYTTKNSFTKFQTAKKNVITSEATLSKAQKHYDETYGKNNTKNLFVGFQTGAGKNLGISEVALLKAKKVYDEVNRDPKLIDMFDSPLDNYKSNKNINLPGLKLVKPQYELIDKTEISRTVNSLQKSLELKNKRKHLEDDFDDTPVGCKRPRLGLELQGRKLFNEIEEEERELAQASMYFDQDIDDNAEKKNNNNNISELKVDSQDIKNSLSEEIEASALALFEDEQKMEDNWSCFVNKTISRNSLSEKICQKSKIITKRAKSLPDNLELNPIPTSYSKKSPVHEFIPDDIVFDSQFSLENIFLDREKRQEAISEQEKIIKSKRSEKIKPIIGSLLSYKLNNRKISWLEFAEGSLPILRNKEEASPSDSGQIALSYQFQCDLFYNKGDLNEGVAVGDGAKLIPNAKNFAGVNEFKLCFLASPGVDPSLVPEGWFENHYKWIIWKLASLDKLQFGNKRLKICLTPDIVMKQLKYRYDREIDRHERPALRRILEKDDSPSRRMILCVSKIFITQEDLRNFKTQSGLIELTDGWYSIVAVVDGAMVNLVKTEKVKVGTKLMVYGSELLNHTEGCYPLEVPEDVKLKIHTNSTRRARWDAKLGYQRQCGPMPISLKSIKMKGGLISKLTVLVARIYPICYKEKMPNGDYIIRNSKSEEKAASVYENERQILLNKMYNNNKKKENGECFNSLPRRDVTPFGKIRIADGDYHSLLTLWTCPDEAYSILKENMLITVSNTYVSSQRQKTLMISTNKYTTFDEVKGNTVISYPKRVFTSIESIYQPNFNPSYSEFDTVGLIVSKGAAPHGMNNFETANLAFKSAEDTETFYLSVLFWEGISSYGYSDTLTVGSFIACSNVQRRSDYFRSIPFVYCTEDTILTQYPKQNYLKCELDSFRSRINDVWSYVKISAAAIEEKIHQATTPGNNIRTPESADKSFKSTPCTSKKSYIINRLEKLQAYDEPPAVPQLHLNHSKSVSREFKSPTIRFNNNDAPK